MRASKLPPALQASKQPTQIKDSRGHHWSQHATAALGGALSRALLNPEHRQRHCPQCPAWVSNHRGALQHDNTGRAQYSHWQSCLWQGTGEGRYPARSFEAWEANHPATASWAPLPVLGARSHPQDMRDDNIVTLYKNKGDRSDCNNYRSISLLSIIGKVFPRVTLTCLHSLDSQVYPKSQCGFRAGRSTVDMIFSLRQMQGKCRQQQQPLFLAFVDLTKAFDLVSRSGHFKILQKIGCPPKLLAIITSFHQDMQSTVCFYGATSNAFPVSSGVKQGCVLAPTLFRIFFSMLLQYAFVDCTEGVYIRTG